MKKAPEWATNSTFRSRWCHSLKWLKPILAQSADFFGVPRLNAQRALPSAAVFDADQKPPYKLKQLTTSSLE
jgi:hypothetical protein